jgi:hypothetical protein
MAMPRKGSRKITIDGRSFRWRAWYADCWQDGYCIPLRLVVELDAPPYGQRLRAAFRWDGSEIVCPDEQAVTPGVVRRIIEAALQRGWRPGERGLSPFELDGQPFLDAELLRGKSAPELRGAGWLKILGRLERDFGMDLRRFDLRAGAGKPGDVRTAGQLWELLTANYQAIEWYYQANGEEAPRIGWEAFAAVLSEELGLPLEQVRYESRLAADLGMGPDMDH